MRFLFNGVIIECDPESMVAIGPDMNEELRSVLKDMIKVGRWLAGKNAERDMLKVEIDNLKGSKYHSLKMGRYQDLYQKAPTVDGLDHALNEDDEVLALRKKHVNISQEAEEIWNLKMALNTKFDALKEIGAHVRQEKRLIEIGAGA